MSTDLHPQQDTSVTALVSGIVHDAQELLRQQLELFKHEVKDDLRKTREVALLMAAGGGVAVIAIMLLTLSLVFLMGWAFHPHLPLWACFGICGGIFAVIAAGLLFAGKAKLDSFNPLPDESAQ